ncbi:MAG: hypothetical protein KAJ18_10725 [Candidatus Omnitrophica bacterium]|nr:hypothetical protein [Candidatus Omnitrophota bacterium]
MMWTKWLPWRMILSSAARKSGFLDPVEVISRLEQFSEPSEVAAPIQLLKSGVILHARGLINSQAIQHNLDWVWPYWVECQFDPKSISFIPRSFSITHINLTHRNWTAVGIPDYEEMPIVDPRGLVTPIFDGWSIDCWIISEDGESLIPSRLPGDGVDQNLEMKDDLMINTKLQNNGLSVNSEVRVEWEPDAPYCHIKIKGCSIKDAWLVVSLRPYNPEGISFIHDIHLLRDDEWGWNVNNKYLVYFDVKPDRHAFSYYRRGDVYSHLQPSEEVSKMYCKVGMATAAAQFKLKAREEREVVVKIPLRTDSRIDSPPKSSWEDVGQRYANLEIPDEKFKFLYEAAVRTLILHSPKEVFPGPYTYKRFWFRDAAYILYAMLCVGLEDRVERVINCFTNRQTKTGYFLSQEGEWDSNGEAMWIIQQFCAMTERKISSSLQKAVDLGGRWIMHKRLSEEPDSAHSGLLPSGFSAEHLGPNDYYYWDDFWGVAGLNAAGFLTKRFGDSKRADNFFSEAKKFDECIESSLKKAEIRVGSKAMPPSPYRRLDAGSIGSIVAGYPLKLMPRDDPRLVETCDFLIKNTFHEGGFFQDMTHSGINPYLTLHIAQVLLRNNDSRYLDLMKTVAGLASPTGQWPEAVHPHTKGGCMGDGQHVWAAAEWVLMIRNCFVREEVDEGKLILCSGIPRDWINEQNTIRFGPAPTMFGKVNISISCDKHKISVCWEGKWFKDEPRIEIQLPGFNKIIAEPGQTTVCVKIPGDDG